MAAGLIALAMAPSSSLSAQGPNDRRTLATRADLEALWAQIRPEQRTTAEAVALKERLDNGDFHVGDKVIIRVRGDTALSDTFTVKQDQSIEMANIGAISLHGVLHSEAENYVRTQLAKYIKSPDVHVESLMRISVSGQVTRPGFYNVSANALIGDVLTQAGGLTNIADISRTQIHRGGQAYLAPDRVQKAITQGLTLDQMNLQSGDEIELVENGKGHTTSTVLLVGSIAAALLSIVAVISIVAK